MSGRRGNPLTATEQSVLRARLREVSGMAQDDLRAGHGGGEDYWRGQQAALASVLLDHGGKLNPAPPVLSTVEQAWLQRVLRYFGLRGVRVRWDQSTPDIAILLGADPTILLGRKYRASGMALRRQKLTHEVAHQWGLGHDDDSRALGYYSDPSRDRLSARIRDDIAAGSPRFRPEKFGIGGGG